MHIPDNYLSPSTCAVLGTAMLTVWRRASIKIKSEISRKRMPLLGIAAAFSFLIMMFNLPLPGGTTGHAVGAALAAILLGPWPAVMAITVALAVQALFFGDGGILVLGANTFNMAFVMPFAAHYIFRMIKGKSEGGKRNYTAAFIAGYLSLNIAALLTAVEFGIQPLLFRDAAGAPLYCPYGLSAAIPAMVIPHMILAGVVEGFVTAGVYAYIVRVSPEIAYEGRGINLRPLYLLLGTMIILTPLGLLASGTAWGEWGINEIRDIVGFVPKGMDRGFSYKSPVLDYAVSGLSELWGYVVSALIGAVILVLLFKILGRQLKDEDNLQVDNNPDWLFKEDNYIPGEDKAGFINKSIFSILKVLSKIEEGSKRKTGFIYSINPVLKLPITIFAIVVLSSTKNLIIMGAVGMITLGGTALLKPKDIKRLLALEALVVGLTFLMLLPALFTGNVKNSLVIVYKVAVSTSLANLLSFTTIWNDVARMLKFLFVSDIFIMVFEITLKYIYLLGRIAEEALEALKARSIGENKNKYGSMSSILGNLFIKSREMGEEMYSAMECRGFTGEYRGGGEVD